MMLCRYSYSAVMTLASSGPVSSFYYSLHTWTLPGTFNATDYIFTGAIRVPGYVV